MVRCATPDLTATLSGMTLTRVHESDERAVTRAEAPAADRWAAWMSSTSIVFPAVALAIALSTFITVRPTPLIVLLLAVALTPWALVAGGIDVPPVAVVLVGLGPVLWLVAGYGDQAALFLGVTTCTWASARGLRWTTVFSVAGFTAASVWCSISVDDDKPGWIIWFTGMLFGAFAGALLHRQQALTAELQAARHDLAASVAERERKAIAREVHDIVGHSLTVVLLNIAGARRHLATNPAAASEAMERAEKISRDSLESVRFVVGLLSSTADSQRDAPLPGGADLVPMLEQARRAGLPIVVEVTGDPGELEPTIGLTLVRLLQESLANASRHAPGATIHIEVAVDPTSVTATVVNDLVARHAPVAPGAARTGLGVAGMTDRIAALDGTLDVGVHDGRWTVRGVLPRSLHRRPEPSVT
jgi:signal transduction histidine kinase